MRAKFCYKICQGLKFNCPLDTKPSTMDLVFSANFGTNLKRVVSQSINLWISFTFSWLRISVMALHFFWICFYATMNEHKTQKLSSFYPKRTFVGIEVHAMVSKWYNPSQQGYDQGLKLLFILWEVISTFKWRLYHGSSMHHQNEKWVKTKTSNVFPFGLLKNETRCK